MPKLSEMLGRRGLTCPSCGSPDLRCLETRKAPGGQIRRRKQCANCGRTITTFERIRS